MILGLGTDAVTIARVRNSLDRFGDRFKARVFTEAERGLASRLADPAGFFAKRFAAKEAVAKALGTGMADGVRWVDIETLRDRAGRPEARMTGRAAQLAGMLCPAATEPCLHVSLSDEAGLAFATAILSAMPARAPSGA